MKWLFIWNFFFTQVNKNYLDTFHTVPNSDEVSHGIASNAQKKAEGSLTAGPSGPSQLFAEKLIPVLVDLCLQAPAAEKYSALPDIIQVLGR